jgi:hypothetical protein
MKRIIFGVALTLGIIGAYAFSPAPAYAVNNAWIWENGLSGPFHENFECVQGNSYNPADPTQEYGATNNCDVRIWLYQNPGGSGYNLCVSPGQYKALNRIYARLWISSNTSPCS